MLDDRITVFVADDHPVFLEGISRVLNRDRDIRFVGSASDGEDTLREVMRLEPDVLILDISMPKVSGIQVLGALKSAGSRTKILLLTGTEAKDTVFTAMTLGADGYMLKTADWDDLRKAVKDIAGGKPVIAPEVIPILRGQIQANAADEPVIKLTGREQDVLRLLAADCDTAAIAAHLNIERVTVRKHIKKLNVKLGVESIGGAVAQGIRRGLVE